MRGCAKPGCLAKHYAKALCSKHYMEQWREKDRGGFRGASRTHGEHEAKVIVVPLLWRMLAGLKEGAKGHPEGADWRRSMPQRLEVALYQWSQWMLRRAHAGQLDAWEAKAVLEAWSESPGRLREAAMREPRGEAMVPELDGATVEVREKTPLEEYADYWPGGYPWDNGLEPVPGSRPLPLTQYVTMVGLRNVDWSAIPAGRWEALGKPADADCVQGRA